MRDGFFKALTTLAAMLLLPLLAAGCAGSAPSDEAPAGEPLPDSPGQQAFLNQCVGCHMGGGSPPGPNGVLLHSAKLTDEATFNAYLRHPDNGLMPAFSEAQLSDADVKAIYDYVVSVRPD